MSDLSYSIVGTGAIGGYYGACLQKAGFSVNFLLRSDYEQVKKHGLAIESWQGDFTLPQVAAYRHAAEMPPTDVVIVTLKTTHNEALKTILPSVLKDSGVVLLLQNGLGAEEDVAKIVGGDRIIGGLGFICANKVEPGHIHHLDEGAIKLAQYSPNYKPSGITDRMRQIAANFEQAGIEIFLSEDLLLSRWKKLMWNIPYNGLSVVLDATTQQLMADASARSLIEQIMQEVQLGARSNHRFIPDSYIPTLLETTQQMKPYRTSMKIDYDLGRPLELEAIIGTPLRVAATAGVHLPRIEMLYQQLKFLEAKNS